MDARSCAADHPGGDDDEEFELLVRSGGRLSAPVIRGTTRPERRLSQPGGTFSTPSYAAQMGHWSESLVDEVSQRVGGEPDRGVVADALARAADEMEVLAGRRFEPPRRMTSVLAPNGLPFVDVPDVHVGSLDTAAGVWAVPDPVNRQMANVLQVSPLAAPVPKAAPVADGLGFAGQLLAQASQAGLLSADYVLRWLGAVESNDRMEILRKVMDPAVRFSIPILGTSIGGWWIQLSRRLIWVSTETVNDGRLVEILLDKAMMGGDALPLVAVEPTLIVAPMTRQPADWAFVARVWTEGVQRSVARRWKPLAEAIHAHGIPTITIDPLSTPYEIACQVVLKGFWHGYINGDEPALANVVALAYPRQVARIQRATRTPDRASAAVTLLGHLIRPGFDPAQGAEATRRYVRRKASIAVMQYTKAVTPDRYPWTQVGISERRYYKLLPRFAEKVNGRYDVDQEDVVARMGAYLDKVDKERAVRMAALDVLRSHGFGEEAARKWLQRHRPEDAVDAWPRGRRP